LPLLDVVEYLVIKKLASLDEIVKAMYDYFTNSASPSTVARKHGLSKHAVRGYSGRLIEKAGGFHRAVAMVKKVAPIIMELVPSIIERNGSIARCTLCGEKLWNDVAVLTMHIKHRHPNIVERYTNMVINRIRESIRAST